MLVELSVVEQRYRIVLAVVVDRLPVTAVAAQLRDQPTDRAQLVAPVPQRRFGRTGGSTQQTDLLSASDGRRSRGTAGGPAPRTSPLGSDTVALRIEQSQPRGAAGTQQHLSRPGA